MITNTCPISITATNTPNNPRLYNQVIGKNISEQGGSSIMGSSSGFPIIIGLIVAVAVIVVAVIVLVSTRKKK
jgi:cobalamin biosynthesis Mg chelatase CobN